MNNQFSVFITEAAKNDITTITDYIALDNKYAAIKLVDLFSKTFGLLADYPETGVVKQDITDKNIRIYIVRKRFFVAYRIVENKVEILRILTNYQNIFAVLN